MSRETVEEFLARGGAVKQIPFGESGETIKVKRSARKKSSGSGLIYDNPSVRLQFNAGNGKKPRSGQNAAQ